MNNEYYVYLCYVNDVVKYVGMGKGERYKHCTSGTSSCAELNRDFFTGNSLRVEIIKHSLTRTEAAYKEADIISSYPFDQLYNKQKGKRKDFKGVDKLIDNWCRLTENYDVLTILQVRRYLYKASAEAQNPIKLWGYGGEGWRGLDHKVAKLFGLTPEIIGSKYMYRSEKLPFERIQSNFREVLNKRDINKNL